MYGTCRRYSEQEREGQYEKELLHCLRVDRDNIINVIKKREETLTTVTWRGETKLNTHLNPLLNIVQNQVDEVNDYLPEYKKPPSIAGEGHVWGLSAHTPRCNPGQIIKMSINP